MNSRPRIPTIKGFDPRSLFRYTTRKLFDKIIMIIVISQNDPDNKPSCGITIVKVTGIKIKSGRKLNTSKTVRPIMYLIIILLCIGKCWKDSKNSTGKDCTRKRMRISARK
jgi:hypothetical protein